MIFVSNFQTLVINGNIIRLCPELVNILLICMSCWVTLWIMNLGNMHASYRVTCSIRGCWTQTSYVICHILTLNFPHSMSLTDLFLSLCCIFFLDWYIIHPRDSAGNIFVPLNFFKKWDAVNCASILVFCCAKCNNILNLNGNKLNISIVWLDLWLFSF